MAKDEEYLLGTIADSVIGGECEESLLDLIKSVEAGTHYERRRVVLERLNFPVPDNELTNPNFTACIDRKA